MKGWKFLAFHPFFIKFYKILYSFSCPSLYIVLCFLQAYHISIFLWAFAYRFFLGISETVYAYISLFSKSRRSEKDLLPLCDGRNFAYSARTAHPFRRNGAPFRFKLSKAQQVDYLLLVILRSLPGNSRRYALDVIRLKQASA